MNYETFDNLDKPFLGQRYRIIVAILIALSDTGIFQRSRILFPRLSFNLPWISSIKITGP